MADKPEIQMKLEAQGQLKRLFNELPVRVREKGLKQSANAGGTPLVRAIRRAVPVDSGLLKKSITKVVKLYRNSETAIAVIGASKDVSGEVRGNLRKPSKYIAILNVGAKAHGYRTRKGQTPGFTGLHFMEQAQATEGANALEKAQNKLAEVIERETGKLNA